MQQNLRRNFNYPQDKNALSEFLSQNINVGIKIKFEISCTDFFLDPKDIKSGIMWYTDPYGIDGGINTLDEKGCVSISLIIDKVWDVARHWHDDRDERGRLVTALECEY